MEEKINIENNRDEKTIGKIFFYRDGNSPWYRAYELSAYYAVNYNNGLSDNEKLNAHKKTSKLCENGIMQIGLQLTSFKKYFPDVEVSNITEDSFTIDFGMDGVTTDNYRSILSNWKKSFEYAKSSKKQKDKTVSKTIFNSPVSFSMIMKEIIRYDTNNRTEDDLRQFICTLKDMCAELI